MFQHNKMMPPPRKPSRSRSVSPERTQQGHQSQQPKKAINYQKLHPSPEQHRRKTTSTTTAGMRRAPVRRPPLARSRQLPLQQGRNLPLSQLAKAAKAERADRSGKTATAKSTRGTLPEKNSLRLRSNRPVAIRCALQTAQVSEGLPGRIKHEQVKETLSKFVKTDDSGFSSLSRSQQNQFKAIETLYKEAVYLSCSDLEESGYANGQIDLLETRLTEAKEQGSSTLIPITVHSRKNIGHAMSIRIHTSHQTGQTYLDLYDSNGDNNATRRKTAREPAKVSEGANPKGKVITKTRYNVTGMDLRECAKHLVETVKSSNYSNIRSELGKLGSRVNDPNAQFRHSQNGGDCTEQSVASVLDDLLDKETYLTYKLFDLNESIKDLDHALAHEPRALSVAVEKMEEYHTIKPKLDAPSHPRLDAIHSIKRVKKYSLELKKIETAYQSNQLSPQEFTDLKNKVDKRVDKHLSNAIEKSIESIQLRVDSAASRLSGIRGG